MIFLSEIPELQVYHKSLTTKANQVLFRARVNKTRNKLRRSIGNIVALAIVKMVSFVWFVWRVSEVEERRKFIGMKSTRIHQNPRSNGIKRFNYCRKILDLDIVVAVPELDVTDIGFE